MRSDSIHWFTRVERFDLYGLSYDVREAKMLLQAKPRPIHVFSPQDYSSLLGEIDVMSRNIMRADLEVPIIRLSDGTPIDGWHRIAKAIRCGRVGLPYVKLTKTEEKKIRIA